MRTLDRPNRVALFCMGMLFGWLDPEDWFSPRRVPVPAKVSDYDSCRLTGTHVHAHPHTLTLFFLLFVFVLFNSFDSITRSAV